jgi:two-component system sensor histidine kinase UhpB
MKVAAKRKKAKSVRSFEEEYHAALQAYVNDGGEEHLGHAYDLGRRAMAEGKSLMEIAATHHKALGDTISSVRPPNQGAELLRAGASFLAESLSPYEMAHRGFQDAVQALRRMNETLEEEIKRIAYAVHDEAGQLLVAVHLALAEVARDLPKPQQEQFAKIGSLLNDVENQLRRYSHELRPTILDDLGWIPAIRFLAKGASQRCGFPIEIQATFTGRLPRATETALYRTVQEALTNVSKHAKANHVLIQVRTESSVLLCSIEDDGVGFDARAARSGKDRGLGLVGMQERLNAVGGTLSIDSVPGKGTTLVIRIPMEDCDGDSHRPRR